LKSASPRIARACAIAAAHVLLQYVRMELSRQIS